MKQKLRDCIYEIISHIKPFDTLEKDQIADTLAWIERGEPLFRVQKPNIPPKHLTSHFLLFDEKALKILLVDHKKAWLWLPTGGHVELEENPKDAVKRECLEELHIHADFWHEDPLFLTSSMTVGAAPGHTDVTLWYVLRGDYQNLYTFDEGEFNEIRWFDFQEIPYEKSDSNMYRFIEKFKGILKERQGDK
jgi:8-oxo-dGTP pyrophosphatase MutT (NUDIX family)